MMEDLTPLEKRNFLLALSITEGQKLAHLSGFSVPSEDVQRNEVLEIISKWLILSGSEIVDHIISCSSWFIDVTSQFNEMSEEEQAHTRSAICSFGIALVIHLLDARLVDMTESPLSVSEKAINDIKDFLTGE